MIATDLPLNDKPLDLRLGPRNGPGINWLRLADYDYENDQNGEYDDERDDDDDDDEEEGEGDFADQAMRAVRDVTEARVRFSGDDGGSGVLIF